MSDSMTIAICDDEKIAISIVSASVEALFTSRGIPVKIESFTSPGKCFQYISQNPVNLVFLDIAMPEEDGIEFGKRIVELKKENRPEIVFVSSNQDRVFDSFAVQPFGFVRKDQFMKDVSSVLTRYMETRIMSGKKGHRLEIQDVSGVSVIETSDIKYLESFRNNQTVYLKNGENVILHATMDKIMDKVQELDFVRVHKGYIVSLENIKKFNRTEAELFSGEKIPVGRAYYGQAAEAFMTYIRLHGVVGIG